MGELLARAGAPRSAIDSWYCLTMSAITLSLPEELAERARALAHVLPKALEIGLRALEAPASSEFDSVTEVTEFLARLPSAEETLTLRPSPSLQKRISELLEKNRTSGLSAAEEREWQAYEYAEHLVRIAKANAAVKLRAR
jgi:hypothetical protein